MAEKVTGTPEEKAAWREQMRRINDHFPEASVIGSFGRAAVYASFGWPARPLSLRRTGDELLAKHLDPLDRLQLYRDIDLLGACQQLGSHVAWLGPHAIDQGFDTNLQRNPDDNQDLLLVGSGTDATGKPETVQIPGDIALLTPRERLLDGVPVNTPLVGVMQMIERVAPTDRLPDEWRAGYDAARAEFDAFADSIRAAHPEEFLADAVMAPLVELAERNTW